MRSEVNQRYLSYRTAPLTGPDVQALHSDQASASGSPTWPGAERAQVTTGDAIGQIEIPRIGHTYNIVQGTDTQSLEEGPGHYPQTALPGMGQTVAIAGHRTTYLAPFRFLNELQGRGPDLRRDALREVHLRRPVPADRQADRGVGDRRRRL